MSRSEQVDPAPPSPWEKAVQSVKECFSPAKLGKGIDAALAGLGLFGSLALMSLLEPIVGVKLFAAPMMASGIIFFSPASPPNPFGFLVATTGSATVAAGALAMMSARSLPAAASAGAATAAGAPGSTTRENASKILKRLVPRFPGSCTAVDTEIAG